MTKRARLWKRRRRPLEDRPELTEEAVAVMREEGELSRVTRLPVAAGSPPALLLLSPSFPLPTPPAAAAAAASPPAPRTPTPPAPPTRQDPQDLCLADGSRARVTRAGLVIGRRRAPATGDTAPSTPRLEVHDLTRSLSREHARLDLGADGVVRVDDLASGNGTTVQRPDGTTTALVPGTAVALSTGDVLHLGGITASLRDAMPRASPGHRADD